ncbi:MAG: hypothetical protein LBU82_06200 [Treponema sp.]|jgi:hypothetical protein|nr:hypothetical protein [Treponema sp.]
MNKRCLILFSFLFTLGSFLHAWDFGLILNQNAGYGGLWKDRAFDYSIGAVPRVSGLIGETGNFIISGRLEAEYDTVWGCVPELLQTELFFQPGNWNIEIGRMYHSDPLGFVAEGLFDGVKIAHKSGAGDFSAGIWYAGLLYKKRTTIEMTTEETEAYNDSSTYFSPRRFLGALGWEHLGGAVRAKAGILGQFDFFSDMPLNSQYAVAKLSVPVKTFSFDAGGCFELWQDDGELGTAFAAEAGIAFTPETAFKNRLSLLARYFSSGFLPFTSAGQWNLFRVRYSGLSIIALDYVARLHPAFSAGLSSTCYIRNDLETYKGYPLTGEDGKGYFLGNEFFARIIWSPASDLQVNLGGGIFLPSLGDAAPNTANYWRVELNAVFSLL